MSRACVGIALGMALLAGCCRVSRAPPPPPPGLGSALSYRSHVLLLDGDTDEERYAAARALGGHDSDVVRARLRDLLDADTPLLRNAAARSLVELGEADAASALIANLHRDRRTYVTMDAIHHLQALYGTSHDYEPNRGYRHQTERQEAWWRWWAERGRSRPEEEEADEHEDARRALADALARYEASEFEDADAAWAAASALWTQAAEIASSRLPCDVAAVADVFDALARRHPENSDVQNNRALFALNDGRWEAAETAYGQALRLAPDDPQIHNDLGILFEGLGRFEEAEAAYRRAVSLRREDDVAWTNLGDVLAKRGRKGEAVAAYREAERLAPDKWHYHRLWVGRLGPQRAGLSGGRRPRSCSPRAHGR